MFTDWNLKYSNSKIIENLIQPVCKYAKLLRITNECSRIVLLKTCSKSVWIKSLYKNKTELQSL
jgi:hypothetical protein